MLASRGCGDDLGAVQRVRSRQHDRIDRGIGERFGEIAAQSQAVGFCEIAMRGRVADNGPGEPQALALALNRGDEHAPPAAETGDGGRDHRAAAPPRSLSARLTARTFKVPVEEIEHLVPAIRRLLGTVIRPIPREKGVPGPVVTVEFIGLAVFF